MASVRFRLSVSVLALAAFALTGAARAGDTLTVAPAGDWVKPIAFTPSATAASRPWQAGLDIQVNLTDDSATTYTEIDELCTSGIAQPIVIRWNAATETLVVHKVEIRRGAETIDLLDKGQSFRITHTPHAIGAYYGTPVGGDDSHQAFMMPAGVKAGDTVVVAWSIVRHDPALKGHYDTVVTSPIAFLPLDRLYVRAVWPKGKAVHWQGDPLFDGAVPSSSDDHNEMILDRRDVPTSSYAEMADQGWQLPRLVLTDFSGWTGISDFLTPAYATAVTLDAASPLRAVAAQLRSQSGDPKVEVTAALRYLQSHLHLSDTSGGAPTAEPRPADAGWATRVAGPKSVAIELVALLRAMDIKADIALGSRAFGHSLAQVPPDLDVLDQVLVRVEIDGKAYWIDAATAIGEDRDLDHITPPAGEDWALPLRAGAGLEDLTPPLPSQPTAETRIRIDASAGLEAPAQVHIERIYRNDEGLNLGRRLEVLLPGDVDGTIRQVLEAGHQWFRAETVSQTYDPRTGELHLIADGVAQPWETGRPQWAARVLKVDGFEIGAPGLMTPDDLPDDGPDDEADEASPGTDIPANVTYPDWTTTEETVILPNGGKGFDLLGGDAVDATLGGVHYRRAAKVSGGVFTLTLSSQALSPRVSRADIAKDTPALQALARNPVYLAAPLDYASAAADAAAADRTRPLTARALFVRGCAFYDAGESAAAIADFDAALKLQPDWSEALADRGFAKARMKDVDGAAADFKAALASDPQNASADVGEGSLAVQRNAYDDAIAAFTQAIALQPKRVGVHFQRGWAYLQVKNYTAAVADARTELDIAPNNDLPATRLLIQADVGAGKTDEAIAEARVLALKHPDDAQVHSELGALLGCFADNMHNCHPDKPAALDELNKAIALHPTAYAYVNRSQARPLKDIDGRQADLDAALALDPDFDFALLTRAALYLYEKAYDKAVADANTVLARTPNDPQALNIRAIAYGQTKQYDLQAADLDTQLRLNPNNASALNSRCWTRAVRNIDLDKAMDDCNAAITLSPMPGYYDSRALVNFRLGKLDAAVADYNTALAKRPDLAGSLYGRGLVELRQGKTAEGQADIAKATGINPRIVDEFNEMGLTPPANPPV